ncbi:putative PD-(D/E)XK nuclease domain-containing protein [Gammaproteobacteria bacterium]
MEIMGTQTQQQGRQANTNGRDFEDLIAQSLRSKGYCKLDEIPLSTDKAFYIPQFSGHFQSIYGLPMRVDFYAWHPTKFPDGLIIECKYQETSGSADEKFPYVIASLKQTGIPAFFFIIGRGAKRSAVDWAINQQDEKIKVFQSLEEFMKFANRGNI